MLRNSILVSNKTLQPIQIHHLNTSMGRSRSQQYMQSPTALNQDSLPRSRSQQIMPSLPSNNILDKSNPDGKQIEPKSFLATAIYTFKAEFND